MAPSNYFRSGDGGGGKNYSHSKSSRWRWKKTKDDGASTKKDDYTLGGTTIESSGVRLMDHKITGHNGGNRNDNGDDKDTDDDEYGFVGMEVVQTRDDDYYTRNNDDQRVASVPFLNDSASLSRFSVSRLRKNEKSRSFVFQRNNTLSGPTSSVRGGGGVSLGTKSKKSRNSATTNGQQSSAEGSGTPTSSVGTAASIQSMRTHNVTLKYQNNQKRLVARSRSGTTTQGNAQAIVLPSGISSMSSSVSRTHGVGKLLLDPDGILSQPMSTIIQRIDIYGRDAEAFQRGQYYNDALQTNRKLQELALACTNDDGADPHREGPDGTKSNTKNPSSTAIVTGSVDRQHRATSHKDEAQLRFALAQSAYRMGLIYGLRDFEKCDLNMSVKQLKKSLEYYNDLKAHLTVTGMINMGQTNSNILKNVYESQRSNSSHFALGNANTSSARREILEDLQKKLQRKITLVLEVCDVMLTLSQTYTRQGKYVSAHRICDAALLIVGDDDENDIFTVISINDSIIDSNNKQKNKGKGDKKQKDSEKSSKRDNTKRKTQQKTHKAKKKENDDNNDDDGNDDDGGDDDVNNNHDRNAIYKEKIKQQAWVSPDEMTIELAALRIKIQNQMIDIERSSNMALALRQIKRDYRRKHFGDDKNSNNDDDDASTLSSTDTDAMDEFVAISPKKFTESISEFTKALGGIFCSSCGCAEFDETLYLALCSGEEATAKSRTNKNTNNNITSCQTYNGKTTSSGRRHSNESTSTCSSYDN